MIVTQCFTRWDVGNTFFYIFNTVKDQYDLDIILYSNEHPKNSHVILEQFVYSGYANM